MPFTLPTHTPVIVTNNQPSDGHLWAEWPALAAGGHVPGKKINTFLRIGRWQESPVLSFSCLRLGKPCLHHLCPLLQPSPLCWPTMQSTGGWWCWCSKVRDSRTVCKSVFMSGGGSSRCVLALGITKDLGNSDIIVLLLQLWITKNL